jgi:hypothetical protein
VTRPSRQRAPSQNVLAVSPSIPSPRPVSRDFAIAAVIIAAASITAGAVTALWRRVPPPQDVPAPRSSIPSPRPVRRDPAVTAGIIGAAGSIVAGLVAAVVTLVTVYHPPATSTDNNHSQPQTSCPVVVEDYYTELHRNPGIIKALIVVAAVDPDARRCGIDATAIELMKNGTNS